MATTKTLEEWKKLLAENDDSAGQLHDRLDNLVVDQINLKEKESRDLADKIRKLRESGASDSEINLVSQKYDATAAQIKSLYDQKSQLVAQIQQLDTEALGIQRQIYLAENSSSRTSTTEPGQYEDASSSTATTTTTISAGATQPTATTTQTNTTQTRFSQDDATGVNAAILTQNNTVQDDATGVNAAVLTQNRFVQDDATGVDAQAQAQTGGIDEFGANFNQAVNAQTGGIDEFGTNFDNAVKTGYAQPDLGLPSTGSVFDKSGLGLSITDPSSARLRMTNRLMPGGIRANQKKDPTVEYRTDRKGIVSHDSDWRVRITLANSAKIFYQQAGAESTIMAPLIHSGVVFPYTPQITVTHVASYSPQNLTHSNYQSHFYQSSEVQDINISGDFTAQNQDEAKYVLAAIYFFRAATKMFYGSDKNKSGLVGTPPPIVFLNGYGKYYFPNIPCVITSFQHTMPEAVDYIPVLSPMAFGSELATAKERRLEETRIPTASQLTVTLRPMYSRKNIYDNFSLEDFAQGKLLGNKMGGTGGFF